MVCSEPYTWSHHDRKKNFRRLEENHFRVETGEILEIEFKPLENLVVFTKQNEKK